MAPSLAAQQEDSAGRRFEHLGRQLIFPVLLGLLVLVGLALVADVRELLEHLRAFDLALLPVVLGLSLINYSLRYGRWELYLRDLQVRLPRRSSVAVFLVGFVLSVTPGKAGELGKAWLARELGGGAARRTVAVVLAERLTDVLGMVLLVAISALSLPHGIWITVAGLVVSSGGLLALSWKRGAYWLLGHVARLPWLGNRSNLLADVYDHLHQLLRPAFFLFALAVAMLAWGAEALAFVIVVRSYGFPVSTLTGVFDYGLSTLLGALSMLPGGLVATEGSLTALLDFQGLETAAAASATLVIRAATLWFAVLLGLLALPYVWRQLRRR